MFRVGTQRQVFEAMTYDVVWVTPEATLAAAARTIKRFDAGPLPVCANNRLLGVVTDRDIEVRAPGEGRDPHQSKVGTPKTGDTWIASVTPAGPSKEGHA